MDDGLQALEDDIVLVPVLVELGINCVEGLEAGAWCRETVVVCCELRVLERWWPYAYSALCLLVESNAKGIIAGLRGRGNAGGTFVSSRIRPQKLIKSDIRVALAFLLETQCKDPLPCLLC